MRDVIGWLAAVSTLGLLLLSSAPLQAETPETLVACVFERPHGTHGLHGAEIGLKSAGFKVRPLPLQRSPHTLGADLIVFSSWLCEHPEYRAYMARHADSLMQFVERGGVIFHFAAADQRENEPAFLPAPLRAWRSDRDFRSLLVRDPTHPLTTDLPLSGKSPRFQSAGTRSFSWESFAWHEGFRALLAADEDGLWPGMLEGAHGKGRIVLTSLWLDHIRKADGSPYAEGTWQSASAALFRNLERYTRLVASGKAPAVTPDRAPRMQPEPTDDEPVPAWKLAPSDAAVYARQGISNHSNAVPYIVFGRDVKAGQYTVPRLDTRTLLDGLALQLCRTRKGVEKVRRRVETIDMGTLELKGSQRRHLREDGKHDIHATYVLHSARGSEAAREITDGRLVVHGLFDAERGVFERSRIAYAWNEAARNPKKGALTVRKGGLREFRLTALRKTRYTGFRVDVDTAIDKAVGFLKSQQNKEGFYTGPGKSYSPAITSLTVQALLACGVPRTSPEIARALDWLGEQEVGKNYGGVYEAALCLMAFDAAYADEPKRLPPKQRAWCVRALDAIYDGYVPRTGGWTYPGKRRWGDHSSTQYAALGLWAAHKLGIGVSDEHWSKVIDFARAARGPAGERHIPEFVFEIDTRSGQPQPAHWRQFSKTDRPEAREFLYRIRTDVHGETGTGAMTFGAIASLIFARAALQEDKSPLLTKKLDREIDEMIVGGWAWLDHNWSFARRKANHGHAGWQEIHLYGIERAGVLSNVKLVGGKDWYFEGAVYLLAHQHESGWIATDPRYRKVTSKRSWWAKPDNKLMATAYALLFLKRATAPVTAGK